MLVAIAPGQGAQTPGFLTPWLELPGVAERMHWLSATAGLDLVAAGTTADAEQIRDTRLAQPLLVASGIVGAALLDGGGLASSCAAVAGHSVGEITAAAVAGALADEAAMSFVRERAQAMAEVGREVQTGMSAVLGGDSEEVARRAQALGLEVANHNGAGQVVVAGALDALAELATEPPDRARVRPLAVAAAFHTAYMAAARRHLERLAGGVRVRDPRVPLVSNADGALVRTGEDLLGRLVHQVAAPVRWDACMETFGAMGVSAVVELPPGGTLTALIRKALPGVETVALRTPDDLDAARALIDAHRVQPEPAPAWRMLVAPIAGTFRAHRLREGERVPALTSVGDVVSQRTSIPVQASASGVLVEWLASDGDPVSPGQPLARLHPEPHA